MNPAITAAITAAQAAESASVDSIIAKLKKEEATGSDKAVLFEAKSDNERKYLDEAIAKGLVQRRADGRVYINERAVSERYQGIGFAMLLFLLGTASVLASVLALTTFAGN